MRSFQWLPRYTRPNLGLFWSHFRRLLLKWRLLMGLFGTFSSSDRFHEALVANPLEKPEVSYLNERSTQSCIPQRFGKVKRLAGSVTAKSLFNRSSVESLSIHHLLDQQTSSSLGEFRSLLDTINFTAHVYRATSTRTFGERWQKFGPGEAAI